MRTLLLLAGLVIAMNTYAADTGYHGLVCRGVEESGRLVIGQPGFGPHLISIFVTGPNPLSATQTLNEHVAWVNDPLHSYVPDGTGGMVIWAHPSVSAADLLAVPGITGFELNYAGSGTDYDKLADEIWRGCVAAKRPFLWGYAADDTHGGGKVSLSWFMASLASRDERALKQAMRSGALYVSCGPVIDKISSKGSTITLELGQEAEVAWLRAGQYLAQKTPGEFSVTTEPGENKCVQLDQKVRTSTLDLSKLGVPAGELQFVRAIVRTEPDKVAQTEPFRVLPTGEIVNPYPAQGTWIKGQTHNHSDTPPWSNTGLARFRLGYQGLGLDAAFSTDYSYWESPYQWWPEDGTPQVLTVRPDRLKAGSGGTITIEGINFGTKPVVRLGGREVRATEATAERVQVTVPGDLAAGQFDVVVDNEKYRGTLALGFTVQQETRGKWESYTPAEGLAYNRALCVACPTGRVWVGTMSGLSRLENGKWENLTQQSGAHSMYAMVAAPDGGLWVATDRGLSQCDAAGKWTAHVVGNLENIDKNRSTERWGKMTFAPDGSLWAINRWSAGIGVYKDGKWARLTKADGLPANAFVSVASTPGGMWIGGDYGLFKQTGDKWEKAALPAEAADTPYVTAMAAQQDGSVWVGLTGKPDQVAVARFADGKCEIIKPSEAGLLPGRVRDVLVSRDGCVWFASDIGVSRRDAQGKWSRLTTVNSGLLANTVLGMAEDETGAIWFATSEGASRLLPAR
ncbi:MAG: IPT/TIG domain-containing protein [Armatimonadia bacterium]